MNSAKEPESLRERLVALLHLVPGGALLFAIIPLVVLGYLGWFYYGADHLDQALYAVTAEDLEVTPQPTWIRRNVTDEVFHNNRLDRVSLLDPKSNATIAQAFETHPWVKSAKRVTKSAGGRVAVDLVFRKPLAMVYCQPSDEASAAGDDQSVSQAGFFPIDADGVILPVDDFDESHVWEHFLIFAQGARPAGDIGMPFGDSRITEALRLCAFLEPQRKQLGIQRVYVDHDPRAQGPNTLIVTLETNDKHLVRWGHVPGAEDPRESAPADKLRVLNSWLEQQRSANQTAGTLDLVRDGGLSALSTHRARQP